MLLLLLHIFQLSRDTVRKQFLYFSQLIYILDNKLIGMAEMEMQFRT